MDSATIAKLHEVGADPETALRRVGGNEKLYVMLLKQFADGKYIQRVEEGLSAGDIEKTRAAMHDLKGSAANLGLDRLSHVSNELHSELREGRLPASADEWRKTCEDVLAVLRELQ